MEGREEFKGTGERGAVSWSPVLVVVDVFGRGPLASLVYIVLQGRPLYPSTVKDRRVEDANVLDHHTSSPSGGHLEAGFHFVPEGRAIGDTDRRMGVSA
jgi:hypothetical protein